MPEVIRFAKGTASEHLNFTGENGEITLICDDTPNRKVTGVIRLHDGQTVGGIPFGGSQLLNDMHDVNAANTIEFQVMTVDANGQFYFANTVETIADGTISGDKIYGGTISTSAAVFEGSSANAIVRITQTGTGNALVVEDSANPDSTPFVVDANGNVGIGASTLENKFNVNVSGTVHASGTLPPGITLFSNSSQNNKGTALTFKDQPGDQGVAGIASFRLPENGGYNRDLRFYVNNNPSINGFNEAVRINSIGYVKIGQGDPYVTLDIQTPSFGNGVLTRQGNLYTFTRNFFNTQAGNSPIAVFTWGYDQSNWNNQYIKAEVFNSYFNYGGEGAWILDSQYNLARQLYENSSAGSWSSSAVQVNTNLTRRTWTWTGQQYRTYGIRLTFRNQPVSVDPNNDQIYIF